MRFYGRESLQRHVRSPDKRVDLRRVHIVELLHRVLDVPLVGLDVNDEDEGVVVLDLLHGRLGVERVLDRAELVHAGQVGHGLAGVFGRPGETERGGAVEGDRGADLADRVGRGALERRLLSGLGLGILGLGRGW